MKKNTPPFSITLVILKYIEEIAWALGIISGRKLQHAPLILRRGNNIKTIQASLAIEGNTLSLDQMTALLQGKKILGPEKDIKEFRNAVKVYDNLMTFNPLSLEDLLKAHALMMEGLIEEAGQLRRGNVGIFKGAEVSHVAPPAKRVPDLAKDLFQFINQNNGISWLLKACIFHYEFEFIHPFQDGNGRMGRLWQQLLLMRYNPIFEWIPIEVLIKENQLEYYHALGTSDEKGESTPFIEFSLKLIAKALHNQMEQLTPNIKQDASFRLSYACYQLNQWFSRKEYMGVHPEISSATASRDLLFGLQKGILLEKGEKNQSLYFFNQ